MLIRSGSIADFFPSIRFVLERWSSALSTAQRPRGLRNLLIGGFAFMLLWRVFFLSFSSFFDLPDEYVSSLHFFGIPVLAWGIAPRAWIAFGSFPIGFLAIGAIPIGVLSFGGLAMGIIAFSGLSIGIAAVGGVAVGLIVAVAGLAVGYYSLGGLSIGALAYSGNGVARGYYVAQGRQSEKLWGMNEPS